MKYYKTKDVYFGIPTINTRTDGFYKTGAEAFIKENEESYIRLKAKKETRVKPFYLGTNEYLTVSELFPIVSMMENKKIPDTISERIINIYLLKYKLFSKKEIKTIEDYKEKRAK